MPRVMPQWLKKKLQNQNAALSKSWQHEGGMIRVEWNDANKSRWKATLELVKGLEGARYDPKTKTWIVASTKKNEQILEADAFRHKMPQAPEKILPPPQWKDFEIDEGRVLPGLRDYQIETMHFLCWRRGRGGIIADPPGVGKTLQGIGWMHYTQSYPVLLVVPAGPVKQQWANNIQEWLGHQHKFQILQGTKVRDILPITTIINWDILSVWCGRDVSRGPTKGNKLDGPLGKINWQLIIGDEIHAIGSMESKRTRAFWSLAKKCPNGPIGLSGTPIHTKVDQFWPMLHLVSPIMFPSQSEFRDRYCAPKHDGYSWDYSGASNRAELHSMIQRCCIRREKSILNLPEKTREPIFLDISGMEEYLKQEREFMANAALLTAGKIKMVELEERLANLNRTAYKLKEPAIIAWLKDQLEISPEPMLVGAWHIAVLEKLMEEFKEYKPLLINGSVSPKQKEKAKNDFVAGKSPLMFANMVCMTGMDGLQKVCSRGAFVEFGVAPNDHIQFEDRLYRSGQHNPSIWYYLLARGAKSDLNQLKTINERASIMDEVLDGKSATLGGNFVEYILKEK